MSRCSLSHPSASRAHRHAPSTAAFTDASHARPSQSPYPAPRPAPRAVSARARATAGRRSGAGRWAGGARRRPPPPTVLPTEPPTVAGGARRTRVLGDEDVDAEHAGDPVGAGVDGAQVLAVGMAVDEQRARGRRGLGRARALALLLLALFVLLVQRRVPAQQEARHQQVFLSAGAERHEFARAEGVPAVRALGRPGEDELVDDVVLLVLPAPPATTRQRPAPRYRLLGVQARARALAPRDAQSKMPSILSLCLSRCRRLPAPRGRRSAPARCLNPPRIVPCQHWACSRAARIAQRGTKLG
jgi:hypothetical protein